jgi:hypothetical protein
MYIYNDGNLFLCVVWTESVKRRVVPGVVVVYVSLYVVVYGQVPGGVRDLHSL